LSRQSRPSPLPTRQSALDLQRLPAKRVLKRELLLLPAEKQEKVPVMFLLV
jgi:hypothetical protein